jgi:hypothetical protein
MRIKNAITIFLLLLTSVLHSQIKIDDVGDGWYNHVTEALSVIKSVDTNTYNDVIKYCNHISFWLGSHSTTQYPSSIIISKTDMELGSINNLACLIVHEVVHLRVYIDGIKMTNNQEELYAYLIEREFALKIGNIEHWILVHINKQIWYYKLLINDD